MAMSRSQQLDNPCCFTDNDSDSDSKGAVYITAEGWFKQEDLGALSFTLGPSRNLLKGDPRSQSLNLKQDQYFNHSLNCYKKIGNNSYDIPVLPLTGVTILYSNGLANNSKYGVEFARFGIRKAVLDEIFRKVGTLGLKLVGTGQLVNGEQHLDSKTNETWIVFLRNVKGVDTELEGKGSEAVAANIRDVLLAAGTDLKAHITFRVDLKYRGPIKEEKDMRFELDLTPSSVSIWDTTGATLQPNVAGLTKNIQAFMPEGMNTTPKLMDLISKFRATSLGGPPAPK